MFGSAVRYYATGAVSLACSAAFYMLYPERPLVFDLSPRVAFDSLRQTDLPPLVFGTTTSGRVIVNSATSITWSVQEGGKEMMRYTATLTPEADNRTRVTIDFRTGARGEVLKSADRLERMITIRKLYLTAIKERISSSLEGRTFNVALIYPMTMVAALANQSAIFGQIEEYSKREDEKARRNMRKAYAEGDRY